MVRRSTATWPACGSWSSEGRAAPTRWRVPPGWSPVRWRRPWFGWSSAGTSGRTRVADTSAPRCQLRTRVATVTSLIGVAARRIRVAMTIATSDSGGGAGIQADLKAFARCGVHGTSAIVALTAQNTQEVISVETLPRQFILDQVRAVVSDMGVDAVKIGMLFDEPTIEAVDEALGQVGDAPVVLDPVMVAESGAVLLQPEARQALIDRIVPRATVVTPNAAEARELTGLEDGASPEDLVRAVHALGPRVAIVTGGHLDDGADRFFDGESVEVIEGPRHP